MNTGLPGPPIPGEVQNPIHLDRVCVRFPELKLCMMHGADPWWDVAIRLMIKYANLRLMTSAWSPRHLPESLLHFMSTRGKSRVMFASDSPVLSITRCVKEAAALDLPPEVLDNYLYRQRPGLLLQPLTPATIAPDRLEATMDTSELDPRVISSATPRRTSRGSRSTTRSAGTRTTRRCGARWRAYLDELATDDDIKVVILRGADGVFSTGADMATRTRGTAPTATKRRPSQRRRLGVDRESFGFYHELPDASRRSPSRRSRPTRSAARSSSR